MSLAPSPDKPARFTFHPLEAYRRKPSQYTLLPFRFMRFDSTRYVLVNEVGEFIFLGDRTFRSFATHALTAEDPAYLDLKAKHFPGHTYRIVVSDLVRHRPIWFGGTDRSEASLAAFYAWLGPRKAARIRLAVMDMWKPFRLATAHHAPQASVLFDKFHVLRHLGDALDQVRKSEYARVSGRQRRFIKGQKYTLLAHRENLTLSGRRALTTLLAANKRLNTAYLLKESFGQLWDYGREGWARRFFEHWRAALKWQRLQPYEKFAAMIDRHWDGIAAYCRPENKVALGFVEGLNNKIRVLQRRAYGLRDEEYLRLKILTCMLPAI